MVVEAIACRCELSRQPFRGTSRNSDCHSLKSPACSVSLDQGSWGWVSAIDSNGRKIWIADAHRDDGKRFVVRADEGLPRLSNSNGQFARRTAAVDRTFFRASIHLDKLARLFGEFL